MGATRVGDAYEVDLGDTKPVEGCIILSHRLLSPLGILL